MVTGFSFFALACILFLAILVFEPYESLHALPHTAAPLRRI